MITVITIPSNVPIVLISTPVPRVWVLAITLGTGYTDICNASAQFNLGVMHRSGIGVPQNTKLAIKWYTLAANQGLAPAQSILGSIYRIGKDAPKDDKLARKWYALAAEQEDTDATYYLGVLYRRGPLKDHVFAHMWWDIAASLGDRMAAKNRDLLAQKMSLQQIRKAHKLARQCIKNKYKNC